MRINPDKAAEIMGVSKFTLKSWRTKGIGPPYYKRSIGKRHFVEYEDTELIKWLEANEERVEP